MAELKSKVEHEEYGRGERVTLLNEKGDVLALMD